MSQIDIKGLDKAEVLLALYNHSKPLGLGWLQEMGKKREYTLEDARRDLEESSPYFYFDYLYGRVMKVDLSKDTFDGWLYDRDNGEGEAQKVIDELRKKH